MFSTDRDRGEIRGDRPRAGPSNDEEDPAAESLRDQSAPGSRAAVVRSDVRKREYRASEYFFPNFLFEPKSVDLSSGHGKESFTTARLSVLPTERAPAVLIESFRLGCERGGQGRGDQQLDPELHGLRRRHRASDLWSDLSARETCSLQSGKRVVTTLIASLDLPLET